jgi:integrase
MARPSKGGAHKTTKTLADGSKQTYYYAYPGGPRLLAEPDTRAFAKELAAAIANRGLPQPAPAKPRKSTSALEHVVDLYLDSQDFLTCGERTRRDYRQQAAMIVKKFGTLDVSALADAADETRGLFLDYRDELAKKSLRQADYFLQVLKTVLNWGKRRGKLAVNPLRDAGVKNLYDATRADKIWSDPQIDEFRSRAQPEIDLAIMLALWTGQRQGDLLRLTWAAYDGAELKLTQGKGNVPVQIPVGGPLKKLLDNTPRKSPMILVNSSGIPWTEDGFRTMWHKTAKRAKIVDRTFHDLRGTAVTKLAVAGCNPVQIASITGHSFKQVTSILERHYLARDPRVAREAISLLEAYEERQRFPNRFPNRSQPIETIDVPNRYCPPNRQ